MIQELFSDEAVFTESQVEPGVFQDIPKTISRDEDLKEEETEYFQAKPKDQA